MNPRAANRSVEKLRSLRVRGDRDVKLATDLAAGVMEAKKRRKALGGIGAVWAEFLPEILSASAHTYSDGSTTGPYERATVQSFARGVLTIAVSDSATRYQIDRWLRAGGLDLLRMRAPATLTKIKFV